MVAVARLFLSRFRSPWTSPCRRERMRGRERRAAASSASSVSRGDPDAAAPWSASTSTASILPQQEGLEPRNASSIGTRHLGRRRRRREEEGSSSRHLRGTTTRRERRRDRHPGRRRRRRRRRRLELAEVVLAKEEGSWAWQGGGAGVLPSGRRGRPGPPPLDRCGVIPLVAPPLPRSPSLILCRSLDSIWRGEREDEKEKKEGEEGEIVAERGEGGVASNGRGSPLALACAGEVGARPDDWWRLDSLLDRHVQCGGAADGRSCSGLSGWATTPAAGAQWRRHAAPVPRNPLLPRTAGAGARMPRQ